MNKKLSPAAEQKALQKLYAEIPSFTCIEGCTGCCGPVPFTRQEQRNIGDTKPGGCAGCQYIDKDKGGCTVYENRPFMCRLFGTTDALPCPYGCAPEVKLSEAKASSLTKRYIALKPELDDNAKRVAKEAGVL